MSALAAPAPQSVPIARVQAAGLFRWNLGLAFLHGIQFVAMLVLSFAKDPVVSSPVVSTYLEFEPATRTLVAAQRPLFDLPIGPRPGSASWLGGTEVSGPVGEPTVNFMT